MEVMTCNIKLEVGGTYPIEDKHSGKLAYLKVIREATLKEYLNNKDVKEHTPDKYFYVVSID